MTRGSMTSKFCWNIPEVLHSPTAFSGTCTANDAKYQLFVGVCIADLKKRTLAISVKLREH